MRKLKRLLTIKNNMEKVTHIIDHKEKISQKELNKRIRRILQGIEDLQNEIVSSGRIVNDEDVNNFRNCTEISTELTGKLIAMANGTHVAVSGVTALTQEINELRKKYGNIADR